MIIFVLGLVILYGVLVYILPEYITELAVIIISIEASAVGLYIMIKNKVEDIVRKHRNILREEILNDVEKLYRCKNLNDIVNFRLDR